MLIDAFDERWLERLDEAGRTADYLLIDGAFVPGLYRRFLAAGMDLSLLFDILPACSDATRNVSPFLARWKGCENRLNVLLCECSGYPMVSAISTAETLSELTARLAAWCVVQSDGQRFNFRFADTRRLPAIFNAMLPAQRGQFVGPASRWSYIGREGNWRELSIEDDAGPIADQPLLDEHQFARLVNDSEADEVIAMLDYRGVSASSLRSTRYAMVCLALTTAAGTNLDVTNKLAWCGFCIAHGAPSNDAEMPKIFEQWAYTNQSPKSRPMEEK